MICNTTVDEKILSYQSNWLQKHQNKKTQQKHKIHANSWLQTLNDYNMTTNGTVLASEPFSFWNTGKWSGVAIGHDLWVKGHPTHMTVLKMASSSG